jgi:glycosyltransferase involved in cell wall biosynthesis
VKVLFGHPTGNPNSHQAALSHFESGRQEAFCVSWLFGLVLLEAMACGLPVLSSECTAAPDILTKESGSIVPAGNLDAWVEALRLIGANRDHLPPMKDAERTVAVGNSWKRYRQAVSTAVDHFIS